MEKLEVAVSLASERDTLSRSSMKNAIRIYIYIYILEKKTFKNVKKI